MKDTHKTKTQLLSELEDLRARVALLEEKASHRKSAAVENEQFAALGKRLNRASSAEDAARIILELADQLLGWDACTFDLYSQENDTVYPVVNIDTIDGKRAAVPPTRSGSRPTSRMRRALDDGSLLILREQPFMPEEGSISFGDKRSSASILLVPIWSEARVIGFVSIQRYSPRAYDSGSLTTLETLADYCGGGFERILAEKLQRESEARLQTIIENMPFAFWARDKDGRCIMQNARTRAQWGDQIGKFPDDTAPSLELLNKWRENNRRAFSGEVVRDEFEITEGEHAGYYYEVVAPIRVDGDVHGILVVSIDITDRKRAEEALRESEAKFRALAQTAASVILIYQDSKLVYVNPFAAEVSGYSAEDQLSMDFWEIIHPDHREIVKGRGLTRLRGELVPSRYEVKILTKNGETRWLDFSASSVEFQGKPSVLGTALDITERKLAEEALHKSQFRLHHVLSSSPAIVYSLRVEGDRFIPEYVSDSITRLTGYTITEALRNDWWASHLHPEDREDMLAQMSRIFENDRLVLEYRFQHKDEGCHWIHDELRLIRDESGKAVEVIGSWSDVTERREAEIALRASEERYRDMVENARDIIYMVDLEGNVTSVNQAIERITGYTREEALKLNLAQVVAPEYIDIALRMLDDKLAGEKETGYDVEIIAKDGRRITVAVITRPVLQNGVTVAIQGIARDVTARKRAEDALRESEAHLQAILDNCPAMIFLKDIEGRYLEVNREFERTFNLAAEQVLGRTDDELFPPELAAAFRATDRIVLDAGHSLEFEEMAVYADGPHAYIVNKFPLQDATGKVYALGGISTDITARKLAEDDLLKQKEILQKIIDHIPVMIRFRDEEGRIKLVNREWERTLGWTLEEIEGNDMTILEIAYPDSHYRKGVMDFIAAADGEWTDFKTRTRDGRVIDTSWASVRLADGTTLGIGRDITEQKRAEERLRHQTAQLSALHEIDLEISAESELSRVLELVCRRAAESQNATHCSVYICDRERSELSVTASLDNSLLGARLREGEGLAGRVVATGEAQFIDDYSRWEGRARFLEGIPLGPALAVPLKWQHMVIGAISLARGPGDDSFTAEDAYFLEQIAAESAIAIHQATLFEDLQKAHKRLQVLAHSLIDAQEGERKRLARELHDRIGQALTAVQINLQSMQQGPDDAYRREESLAIVEDALKQAHDLSLELRPSLLDDLGLVAALRWYVDRLTRRAGLLRCFNAELLEIRVAPEIETACFRIAQEALTNVIRHAQATTVWVQLKISDTDLKLIVRDDGLGFAVRNVSSRNGPDTSLGLQGMRERAIALDGLVEITSGPGQGTEVRASFPLRELSTKGCDRLA